MDNHTKQTDPSVEYLVQMFPEEFLRNLAQKTGFIKRIRKIDPVIFFWVLTLRSGIDFLRSISNLWPAARSTRVAAGIKVSCIVSVVADGVKSVKLFPERTSEAKS